MGFLVRIKELEHEFEVLVDENTKITKRGTPNQTIGELENRESETT